MTTDTKIVATLGPACDSLLAQLLAAGVDVFRLNASHGTREEHRTRIEAVRALARETGTFPAILLDLQGPKIRLGEFEGGCCELQTGASFTITTERIMGNVHRASTSYASFATDVRPGDTILLADGSLQLRAISSDGTAVVSEVVRGGPLSNHKGINLPGCVLSTSSLTDKDLRDLEQGLHAGVDFVALSFVRSAADLLVLNRCLEEFGVSIPVIAKIEKPQAWDKIEAILDASDGVMVARGDLGVEMALEQVPLIQKAIIRRRAQGRFVITATQMLESMIEQPTPTRAEVSDVANAIYDGTDAVMLSAETAVGKYPVEAVQFMARIATETEESLRGRGVQELPTGPIQLTPKSWPTPRITPLATPACRPSWCSPPAARPPD